MQNVNKDKKKKLKKNAVKTSVESPFNLNWPSLNYKVYSEVVSSLKESLLQLHQEITSERTKSNTNSSDSKEGVKVIVSKSIANPYVVFGFNAVMRGLEQGKVKCVLVNAEAKPNFLLKTFIPICNLKSLPLIPVKGLNDVVKETIGIKSSLALGLSNCACEENGPFRNLFCKCCAALGYDHLDSPTESDTIAKLNLAGGKEASKTSQRIKPKEIKACHLNRQNKSKRIFKPPKSNIIVGDNILSPSSTFIGISDPKSSKSSSTNPLRRVKDSNEVNRDGKASVDTSECTFYIDIGEEMSIQEPQNGVLHKDTEATNEKNVKADLDGPGESAANENVSKGKKKRTTNGDFSYISTKLKRIRSNPNRR